MKSLVYLRIETFKIEKKTLWSNLRFQLNKSKLDLEWNKDDNNYNVKKRT